MTQPHVRCLILACGNTLRGDDGVGPWLAAWAENRFRDDAGVRVIARQQWTPELAEEIAHAGQVLFIDSSINSTPGAVDLVALAPEPQKSGLATHNLDAPELLRLAGQLFSGQPQIAALLTVGAHSTDWKEELTAVVQAALPRACAEIEGFVLAHLKQASGDAK